MQIPAHFPTEPQLLWGYFHQLNQLPRPSKHEEKVREYILSEASRLGLKAKADSTGNVVVYVPGTKGKENAPAVIIQNHMDMVTDALPSKKIDFKMDPITTFREGDWIKAEGTTLGADNGIGCAAALSLMQAKNLSHPPLELLFTIDEETGLVGAWGVEPSYFHGKRLLNLDTEEWGSFYIGCAGGIDYEIDGDVNFVATPWNKPTTFKLTVGGFLGGHSGVDIHEQRGNAVKFLSEILNEVSSDQVMLHELRAGKAHNIIPRDAWAIVSCESGNKANIEEAIAKVTERWMSFQPVNDRHFHSELVEAGQVDSGVCGADLKQLLSFMLAFPHGAHKYDLASGRELVSLSNNLAKALLVRGKFYLMTSLRFFDRAECVGLEAQVNSMANLMGFNCKKEGEYPSWKPVRENRLLEQMTDIYQRTYGQKPKVTAIHAGLECGILRDKIGPIDAVSFGPTIMGAHSPQERVEVETVAKFWQLLTTVLAEI